MTVNISPTLGESGDSANICGTASIRSNENIPADAVPLSQLDEYSIPTYIMGDWLQLVTGHVRVVEFSHMADDTVGSPGKSRRELMASIVEPKTQEYCKSEAKLAPEIVILVLAGDSTVGKTAFMMGRTRYLTVNEEPSLVELINIARDVRICSETISPRAQAALWQGGNTQVRRCEVTTTNELTADSPKSQTRGTDGNEAKSPVIVTAQPLSTNASSGAKEAAANSCGVTCRGEVDCTTMLSSESETLKTPTGNSGR